MSSQATKIKTLVSKVNLAKGLSRIFNLHLEQVHYTNAKYPYDEKLYEKDTQAVDYLLYQHPMRHYWRPTHPSNLKASQETGISSQKTDISLEK